MVLTKEQYGFDPQDWVITVSNFNVKAILLIEEENVLYRRWDPYTEFNGVNSVPAIPVLQVTLDTGLKILEALMIGNPVDFRLYTAPADVEEFQILKQLYETAIRDGTTTFFVNGWFQMSAEDPASLGADPCLQMWAGVDCNEQGKISHLQLRAMNASGIPAQIGNLKNLTTLYLRDCIFHHWTGGNSIPLSIGYLEKLMLLRVEDAELDGSIPESLGLLSDLKFLLLSRNHLRGVLPTTLMNLALEELDLSFNDLSGTIPVVYFNSPHLRRLRMPNNQLRGGLPSLGAMQNITLLDISNNLLEGLLPPSPYPPQLQELHLGKNAFTGFSGTGTGSWSDLKYLETLNLNDNQLPWPLPQGFSTLTSLRTLNMENNLMKMQFPELFNRIIAMVPFLSVLDFSGNQMYGDIAQDTKLLFPEFGQLSSLDLSNNLLGYNYSFACRLMRWQVSDSLCDLPGTVPETCSNVNGGLKNDDCLFHNSLPLKLPPLIRFVDFSNNYFGDEIPNIYGDYDMMENLDVRGNELEGDSVSRPLQWRGGNKDLPTFASESTTRLKYSDLGGDYHCPLLQMYDDPQRTLWVDPFYYEYQLGFYVDPIVTLQAPHCTPFPTLISIDGENGTFTDGDSGGRVRKGMDTKWHVKIPALPAGMDVKAVTLHFSNLVLNNDSTVFIYAGDTILDDRIKDLSSLDVPTLVDNSMLVTVLNSEALIWFQSSDLVGPHFNVNYSAWVNSCPAEHKLVNDAISDPATNFPVDLCMPMCPMGEYAQADARGYVRFECYQCPADFFNPERAFQTACEACPVGATTSKRTGSTKLTDCECPAGKAGNFDLTTDDCHICMDGFDCKGGKRVLINEGYYKAPGSYSEYVCPYDGACQESPELEQTSDQGIDEEAGFDFLDGSGSLCSLGTSGPLCAVCGAAPYEGQYYVSQGTACEKCGSQVMAILYLLFTIGVIVCGVVIMFNIDPAQHTAIWKIIVSFVQVMYIYVSYINIKWPSGFISYFKWTGIANLAIIEVAPVDCIGGKNGSRIGFFPSYLFNILMIPMIFCIFVTIYLCGTITLRFYYAHVWVDVEEERKKQRMKDRKEAREKARLEREEAEAQAEAAVVEGGEAAELPKKKSNLFAKLAHKTADEQGEILDEQRAAGNEPEKKGIFGAMSSLTEETESLWNRRLIKYSMSTVIFKRRCLNNLLWIVCMVYPGVCGTLLAYFKCERIGNERYLLADYSVNCDGKFYKKFTGLAVLAVLLFVFGTPFIVLGFLLLNRLASRLTRWELDKHPDPMDAIAEFRRPKPPKLGRFTKWVMKNVSGGALESITGPYTDFCFYWEVEEMLRKTVLIAVTVFLGDARAGMDSLVIGVFQTICLTEHLALNPFIVSADMHAQTIALITEVITMQIGTGVAARVFTSQTITAVILVFINTVSLIALIIAGFFVLRANDFLNVLDGYYLKFRRLIGRPIKISEEEKAEKLQTVEKLYARRWGGENMKGAADVNTFSMAPNKDQLMNKDGQIKNFKSNYTTMYQGQLPPPGTVVNTSAVAITKGAAGSASVAPAPLPLTAGASGVTPLEEAPGGGVAVPLSYQQHMAAQISEQELMDLMNSLRIESQPEDILERMAELTANKHDEDIRRRVVEAGAIPLLVSALATSWRTSILPSNSQLSAYRWALQVLTHITRTRDYRDTVREAGLLPKIVGLLQMKKLPTILMQALLQCTINVTAGNKPNQVMLQEEGVPLILVQMMDGLLKSDDDDSANFRFLVLALNAVITADMPYEEKNELVTSGGLQSLIVCLGPAHMDAHVDAVQCINKLCSSNIGLCTSLREHNGLTPLIFLLDWEHASPAVIKSVVICLMNVTRRDVNMRDGICKEGAIAPILGLMGREQERIIVEKATWTLNNLATGNPANIEAVRLAGGVKASLGVLEWARDAPTMKAALATLIHLAEDPEISTEVEANGGLELLVNHAKGEVPNAHKDIALLALNKLASVNQNIALKVQELIGPDLWHAVQVAVLPGTSTALPAPTGPMSPQPASPPLAAPLPNQE
eukprot:CAMPEP_0196598512 /NCGR_PEP_ID=MMETSP1081-20130531/94362_1 /TAXON_ID=36882 /ORGANISM="Pyramimonas amylifera, Strain CCMP720" /LENGTH=2025 /DNA_ID=CAMNT_0041924217 /DNA_START=263 /DNA_END=6340 /DNA_ORIENTATION=-